MTEREIRGVFDGQMMVATDGELYPVPPNYASKSKLVEGDGLVLRIQEDGSFIFKQVDVKLRKRMIASVIKKEKGKMIVEADGAEYNILDASVSFYKLKDGDKVAIAVPSDIDASWAAIEYVIQ